MRRLRGYIFHFFLIYYAINNSFFLIFWTIYFSYSLYFDPFKCKMCQDFVKLFSWMFNWIKDRDILIQTWSPWTLEGPMFTNRTPWVLEGVQCLQIGHPEFWRVSIVYKQDTLNFSRVSNLWKGEMHSYLNMGTLHFNGCPMFTNRTPLFYLRCPI